MGQVLSVDNGSTWQPVNKLSVNNGSTWQDAIAASVFNGATWQQFYVGITPAISAFTPTFVRLGTNCASQMRFSFSWTDNAGVTDSNKVQVDTYWVNGAYYNSYTQTAPKTTPSVSNCDMGGYTTAGSGYWPRFTWQLFASDGVTVLQTSVGYPTPTSVNTAYAVGSAC